MSYFEKKISMQGFLPTGGLQKWNDFSFRYFRSKSREKDGQNLGIPLLITEEGLAPQMQ